MRVTVTGATGLLGRRIVEALAARGDEVTVLSRDPERARATLPGVLRAIHWGQPTSQRAPVEGLAGQDAVVHLAGEPIAQRWSGDVKRRIRESREAGTRNLVDGIAAADPRPAALVSASAVGYYGPHGDERLDEEATAGDDYLAGVCVAWEDAAQAAAEHGVRVVVMRTGVVLAEDGGALAKMLPPFKLGAGGPVAGGRQYISWVHLDDVVGMYLQALDDPSWSGPVNATAPEPVTNRDFSKALGRALRRPAFAPVPGFAVRTLYGEMADIVTTGQRVIPRRAGERGYRFRHPDLDAALRDAVGR